MSISLGVGAAVGVPAALPHDGDPIVPPGEEVVKPSNTFRNFFIFYRVLPCFRIRDGEEEEHSELSVSSRMQDPNSFRRPKKEIVASCSSNRAKKTRSLFLSLRCNLKSH